MLSVSMNAIENLRNDLFKKVQKLPVRAFDSDSNGTIMSSFTNDIDNIRFYNLDWNTLYDDIYKYLVDSYNYCFHSNFCTFGRTDCYAIIKILCRSAGSIGCN